MAHRLPIFLFQPCFGQDGRGFKPVDRREVLLHLLAAPVQSKTGMGVGLYQAAQLAQQADYRLSLAENQPGAVRFCIAQNKQ